LGAKTITVITSGVSPFALGFPTAQVPSLDGNNRTIAHTIILALSTGAALWRREDVIKQLEQHVGASV
jgi:hypothetical protein